MTKKAKPSGPAMLSIGQAVGQLRAAYPDLSISKVRFLEDEGLLKPGRTKGGYRLFSEEDIGRLEEILRLQNEKFLPLAIIKDRMSGWRYEKRVVATAKSDKAAADAVGAPSPMSLDELAKRTGVATETVRALENFGLVKLVDHDGGLGVGPQDVEILTVFNELMKFGIEARHLRMYENLAQRESLLFQQIISPQIKNKSQRVRHKSLADLRELVALTDKIRRAILDKSLREANLL